jgi:Bifunctional DNA primase/polymerase, N-terminal
MQGLFDPWLGGTLPIPQAREDTETILTFFLVCESRRKVRLNFMRPEEKLKQQDTDQRGRVLPERQSGADPHSLANMFTPGRYVCVPQCYLTASYQQQVGDRGVQFVVTLLGKYDAGRATHPQGITNGRFCITDEQIAKDWGLKSTAAVREARKKVMAAEPKFLADVKTGKTGYATEYQIRQTTDEDRVHWRRVETAMPPRRHASLPVTASGERTTDRLGVALSYLHRGLPIIPVKGKLPAVHSWKPFQDRLPSITEVTAWFEKFPTAGIAIITGAFSGLAVIDIDGPLEAGLALLMENGITIPDTTTVRSARGWHLWCAHPGIPVKSVSNVLVNREVKIDIRGDGGYIVAPPSVHESGVRYYFDHEVDVLAPFPPALLGLLRTRKLAEANGIDDVASEQEAA